MRKDCKKEAKHFDNGVQELAYTLGQVLARLAKQTWRCMLSTKYLLHTCSASVQECNLPLLMTRLS